MAAFIFLCSPSGLEAPWDSPDALCLLPEVAAGSDRGRQDVVHPQQGLFPCSQISGYCTLGRILLSLLCAL